MSSTTNHGSRTTLGKRIRGWLFGRSPSRRLENQRRTVLAVEGLEQRTVPSTFTSQQVQQLQQAAVADTGLVWQDVQGRVNAQNNVAAQVVHQSLQSIASLESAGNYADARSRVVELSFYLWLQGQLNPNNTLWSPKVGQDVQQLQKDVQNTYTTWYGWWTSSPPGYGTGILGYYPGTNGAQTGNYFSYHQDQGNSPSGF